MQIPAWGQVHFLSPFFPSPPWAVQSALPQRCHQLYIVLRSGCSWGFIFLIVENDAAAGKAREKRPSRKSQKEIKRRLGRGRRWSTRLVVRTRLVWFDSGENTGWFDKGGCWIWRISFWKCRYFQQYQPIHAGQIHWAILVLTPSKVKSIRGYLQAKDAKWFEITFHFYISSLFAKLY